MNGQRNRNNRRIEVIRRKAEKTPQECLRGGGSLARRAECYAVLRLLLHSVFEFHPSRLDLSLFRVDEQSTKKVLVSILSIIPLHQISVSLNLSYLEPLLKMERIANFLLDSNKINPEFKGRLISCLVIRVKIKYYQRIFSIYVGSLKSVYTCISKCTRV